jgi:hypothetical protein
MDAVEKSRITTKIFTCAAAAATKTKTKTKKIAIIIITHDGSVLKFFLCMPDQEPSSLSQNMHSYTKEEKKRK